jgi:hypothetical protein
MRIIRRAIVVTVLASVSLGVVLDVAFILFGQVQGEASRGATVLQFLLSAGLLTSAVTLPLGIVGGVLAGLLLQRQRLPASVWVWIIRGIGMGSFVGALGAAVVPMLLWGAVRSPGAGSIMAMFSLVGALGGVLTGAAVAVWCYRAQQNTLRIACSGEPTVS